MIFMRSARKNKGARPRRGGAKLGQHFLTGTWAARKLVEAVDVRPEETILEIGPGKGALTKELLATGAKVVAVEKDEYLARALELWKSDFHNLEVVAADIRDFDSMRFNLNPGGYVVAANIPYYITGEIIRQFLETETQPRAMALLVQKEVAERIVARDGKESILSLSVKAYGTPKIVAKVSRGNFSPPPSVDSAILLVGDISKKFFTLNNVEGFGDLEEKVFFKVVKAGFASKRKFLSSNLAVSFQVSAVRDAFNTCGINPKARAEDLPLLKWRKLAEFLT